jgi:hypothetical protein
MVTISKINNQNDLESVMKEALGKLNVFWLRCIWEIHKKASVFVSKDRSFTLVT